MVIVSSRPGTRASPASIENNEIISKFRYIRTASYTKSLCHFLASCGISNATTVYGDSYKRIFRPVTANLKPHDEEKTGLVKTED
jgi:hypothetical protein